MAALPADLGVARASSAARGAGEREKGQRAVMRHGSGGWRRTFDALLFFVVVIGYDAAAGEGDEREAGPRNRLRREWRRAETRGMRRGRHKWSR
jgi:hypothetical protein